MPHQDDHGHNCGEHAHDGDHDHDHASNGGSSDNLFAHIDRDNVVALNSVSGGSQVIKPWDERMDEQVVSLPPSARNSYVTMSPRTRSTSSRTQTISCWYQVSLAASYFFNR
jgi:hypothetical protein